MTSPTHAEKDLLSSLNVYKYATDFLSTSNNPANIERMEKILDKLHQFRKTNPQKQDVINQMLFDIFDHAYYHSSDYMRQRIHIGVICGFAKDMPSDMKTIMQIMNRVILVGNPKSASFAFKAITQKAIDTYLEQNYRDKDPNFTISYRLKNMLYIINNFSKHKNAAEKKWLHEQSVQLAKGQPHFAQITKDFPLPAIKKRGNKLIPKEPAFVFSKNHTTRHFFSYSYE